MTLDKYEPNLNVLQLLDLPVPVAAQSEARTVFNRSKTAIVGSDPARGIDVYPRFFVLCYRV
jgi:hypothetical protein